MSVVESSLRAEVRGAVRGWRIAVRVLAAGCLCVLPGCAERTALATTEAPGQEAQRIVQELRGLNTPPAPDETALAQAEQALASAESVSGAQGPEYRLMWGRAARYWARAANDSRKSELAEQKAAELELQLSSVQTELVRARAAVEQAKARLGRARAATGSGDSVAKPQQTESGGAQ